MLGMRRATLVLLSFCKVRSLATASSASGSGDLSHESGQAHRLLRVVVIHRHGDRSQIERSAGPKYPESEHVTTSWLSKMPSQETRELLLRAATKREVGAGSSKTDHTKDLYSGRDAHHFPYGQLTELGVQQMIAVGRTLRQQYSSLLPHPNEASPSNLVYARSTDLCRTLMSSRAVLVGLLDMQSAGVSSTPPVIEARSKATETMYPDCNDTPCPAMKSYQRELLKDDYVAKNFPGYHELEMQFKSLLGYEERVRWLTSREVLLCQMIHGIEYTPVSKSDIDK